MVVLGSREEGRRDQRGLAGDRHSRRLDRNRREQQHEPVLRQQVGHAASVEGAAARLCSAVAARCDSVARMRLGVPKETTSDEHRVAIVPETIGRLGPGVDVVIEAGAGAAAAFGDDAYREAGATIGDPGRPRSSPRSRRPPPTRSHGSAKARC